MKRDARLHSKILIRKLTSRPHLKDDDGFYDVVADKKQMIDIVEKYLNKIL